MENELNQDIRNIPDQRKIVIINMICLALTSKLSSKDKLIKSISSNVAEEQFAEIVYNEGIKIIESNIGVDVRQAAYQKKMQVALYDKFEISREVQKSAKESREKKKEEMIGRIEKERSDIEIRSQQLEKERQQRAERTRQFLEDEQRKRAEQDKEQSVLSNNREPQAGVVTKVEEQNINEDQPKKEESGKKSDELVDYKFWLYKPAFLHGKMENGKMVPDVQLVKFDPKDIQEHTYTLGSTQYIIRQTGGIVYATTPNMKDNVAEYEIIIKRENEEIFQATKYGNIVFSEMLEYAKDGKQGEISEYGKAILTELLGRKNLEDSDLHKYMGKLMEVRDETKIIQPYEIIHSEEEYTATLIWEKLEKEGKRPILRPTKIKEDDGKHSERDER